MKDRQPLSNRLYDRLFRRLLWQLSRANEQQTETYLRQTEATIALYSTIRPRLPLPSMRNWAISPDFACEFMREMVRVQPRRILELGSGVSTLIAGYCLELIGGGTITSLEHQEQHAHTTRVNIADHRLQRTASVVHAPLIDVTVGAETVPWYDLSALPVSDSLFDMLLVDGPPAQLHPLARYPALPLLCDRLSPEAIVMLDDANRQTEVAVLGRWARESDALSIEYREAEKGMAVMRQTTQAWRWNGRTENT